MYSWMPICYMVRCMLLDHCLSVCVCVCLSVCLSVCLVMLVYCVQTIGWIKMPLGTEVGLGPCDIVFDGTQPSVPLKGHLSPHFLAHVYCGQMVTHLSNC